MIELTVIHYAELVTFALALRPGWVPAGPMEAARRRKLTGPYNRPNVLAELERAGLIALTPARGGLVYMIRLTEAGRQAVRVMPDDLHIDWYPLPRDIIKAKSRLGPEPPGGPCAYKDGDIVVLRELTPELHADGLEVGQTGTVREVDGKLGVEFDGYSDTGWNAGLHVIKLNARADDGSIVPILQLCVLIKLRQSLSKC